MRWFVVRTSVGPVGALYRALYGLLARLAAARLGRRAGVEALYLTRGAAGGRIEPGISDLDFLVVTSRAGDLPAVRATGRRLARASGGLFDYYPRFAVDRDGFERRWRSAPLWQYRIDEGRASWRRLAGRDLLGSLPPLDDETRRAAAYSELCRWWILFARMATGSDFAGEPLMRNVTCYKAVSELRRVATVLAGGERPASRAAALAGDPSPLAAELRELARRRWRGGGAALVEATCRHLFDFFADLARDAERRPFFAIDVAVEQVLEDEPAAHEPELAAHAAALLDFAGRRWRHGAGAAQVLRSAYRRDDERLLVIDADPERPPSAAETAALVAEHHRQWRRRAPSIELVVLLGEVGFPLTPRMPLALHRGLVTPATAPDVFLELGGTSPPWNSWTHWYLGEWRTNEQWEAPTAGERRRLERLNAAAADGRIVYPRPAATNEFRSSRPETEVVS